MHEVVANQLFDDNPPERWQTALRLREAGYERPGILHMLASVVSDDVFSALHASRPADPQRTRARLEALPGSWEQQRGEIPAEQNANRAERRAAARKNLR